LVVERAIDRLLAALGTKPTHRQAAITLARVYRYINHMEDGIAVLSKAIDARDRDKSPENPDTAALLYNRACYHALLADERKSVSLKDLAISDLERSTKIDNTNRKEAKGDVDFKSLHNDPRFERLTVAANGPGNGMSDSAH
jgi:hypothetical protein